MKSGEEISEHYMKTKNRKNTVTAIRIDGTEYKVVDPAFGWNVIDTEHGKYLELYKFPGIHGMMRIKEAK